MDPDLLEERIADACLRARTDDQIAEDAEAIGVAPARLAIYRRIVRNNLGDVAQRLLPRTYAAIEAAAPGAFGAELASFLDAAGPSTHYLRDLPRELVAWATPRWADRIDLPPYAIDLARHEVAEFAVGTAQTGPPRDAVDAVALDRPVVLREPIKVERYRFAVEDGEGDDGDAARAAPEAPPPRSTAVLIHRDAEDLVHTTVISDFRASLLERLIRGDALGDAVKRACDAAGSAPSDEALGDVAAFLADLAERGVLLGALAEGEPA